jgi:hypothetical protein
MAVSPGEIPDRSGTNGISLSLSPGRFGIVVIRSPDLRAPVKPVSLDRGDSFSGT